MLSHSLQSWNDDKIEDRSRTHNCMYSIIEISCVLDAWHVIRINFHAYRASHGMREICSSACVARKVFYFILFFIYDESRMSHIKLLAWSLITYDNTLVSESVDLGIGVSGSSRYLLRTIIWDRAELPRYDTSKNVNGNPKNHNMSVIFLKETHNIWFSHLIES